LAYDEKGEPLDDQESQTLKAIFTFREKYTEASLSERRIREDVRREKTAAFERTDTYRAIKRTFAQKFGTPPRYAIVPQVEIDSPKMRSKRSTAWFAQSVQRRYDSCMASAGQLDS
jgi:hypothetical protein